MKTRELIRKLQEADPSGELECCVGNADIHFVDVEPAYWDGCLQVLVRDPIKEPYYNIVGAKYVSTGAKVVICPLSIADAVFENEHLPVDFSDLGESQRSRYEKLVAERRRETNEIGNNVERNNFVKYMVGRLATQYGEDFDTEEVRQAATEFYNENLSYLDAMPKDIACGRKKEMIDGQEREYIPSWHNRRRCQWDREIAVILNQGNLKLERKKDE